LNSFRYSRSGGFPPWRAGVYVLRVEAALEDLAGNNVARVFDADRRAGAPPAEVGAQAGAPRAVTFRVAAVKIGL
jgi:hypothetical protein